MEDFGSPGGSFHANHAPPGTPPPPPTKASFLYVHRPWRYTLRAGLALVPALAMLVGSGGGVILGTLLLGLMVVYTLDVLEMAEAALVSAWCTLLAVYVAACAGSDLFDGRRSPAVSLLLLLVNGQCLFLAGLWATLQFRWVRVSFPGVTLGAERCVFAVAPLACGAVASWTVVASVGAANAPFYLAVIFAALYRAFSVPTPSSFRDHRGYEPGETRETNVAASRAARRDVILAPREAATHAMAFAFVPFLSYAAAHAPTLFGDSPIATFEHLCGLAMLFSFPVVFLLMGAESGSLWWFPGGGGDARTLDGSRTARAIATGAALVLFTGGLVGRVLLRSFGEYVRLPAPYGYVAAAGATYGFLLATAAAASGVVGARGGVPVAVLAATTATSGVAAAATVGAPAWTCVVAGASGWCLARSFARGWSSGADHAGFVAGVGICGGWFLREHFGGLRVDLDGVPLSELCHFLLLCAVVSAATPWLARSRSTDPSTTGALACLHALALARCEDALHGEPMEDGEPAYPPYLVFFTSAVGLVLADRLARDGRVTRRAAWFLRCAHVGKLALVAVPGDDAVVPCTLVALAVTAPRLSEKNRADTDTHANANANANANARHRANMSAPRGLAHVVAIVLALVHARFVAFDVAFAASGRRPDDATLFGGLLLCVAAGSTPLVRAHFPRCAAARRALMLCVVAGASLVALRPPMPWKGEIGFWYDAEHVPDVARDDVDVYGRRGENLGRKRGWPAWLLIAAVLAGLFVASAPSGGSNTDAASSVISPPTRFALAAAGGASSGLYLALEYFPGADSTLVACLVAASALSAVGLAFTHAPSASSPARLPWIFAGACACLVAAHASQSDAAAYAGDDRARREDARAGVLGVLAGMSLQAAFAIKLKAEVVRGGGGRVGGGGLRRGGGGGGAGGGDERSGGAFAPFSGRRPAHLVGSASELARRALRAANAGWMPAVGNVATSIAFVASIATAVRIQPESNLHAFALAPILLLLHEDGVVFESLAGRRRYAPPLVAAVVVLLADAAAEIARGAPPAAMATGAATNAWGMDAASAWTAKNAAATIVAAPCAWRLATYLWRSERTSTVAILALAPINALVIVAADVGAARVLACASVACAVGLFVAQRRARAAGMKAL